MNFAGRLAIDVRWDGHEVRSVAVRNTRPHAARLLAGRPALEVMKMVPLLFAVCGRAQSIAAHAAWTAARGRLVGEELKRHLDGYEATVALESAQEHLWRLLVDWPLLLGLAPAQQMAIDWHRRLARVDGVEGSEGWVEAGNELMAGPVLDIVGVDLLRWEGLMIRALLDPEGTRLPGTVGRMLDALARIEACAPAQPAATPFVDAVSAGETAAHLAWPVDEAYAAAPTWDGKPAETGALARQSDHPLLQPLRRAGRTLAARLLARVLDLIDDAQCLAGGRPLQRRADAGRLADGSGLARVETARGMLLHWADASGDHIERYAIVAPTEWNFHPGGTFRTQAVGARAGDETALRRYLEALALALDPCVEYEIELAHA
ncbi:MAG TPA: nickel-dependent hydrogenase large subunit [Burkholderiaceae bacterium]